MKVILLQDVKNVGKRGEIVVVSDGFGVNFIIPKNLGKIANDASLKEYARMKASELEEKRIKKEAAEELKGQIESLTLEFTAKSGKGGMMIGQISPKQVEKFLKDRYNIIIDKHKFVELFPLNAFGITNLKIELYKGVIANIKVHIREE